MSNEEGFWRSIIVDVEPRQKEFRIGIDEETRVEEVIRTLVTQARDEGVSVDDWAKAKIGDQRPEFVLIRKAPEPTRLSPGATFGELEPKITDDEFFLLDVVPEVGFSS
ncbi:MAG: hypothetical protein ACFE8O_11650 [Candidatus Hermodarchaeota archaeon]